MIDDALEVRIPQIALEPILAELAWSFKNDIVSAEIAPDEVAVFIEYVEKTKIGSVDLRYASSLLTLLAKRLQLAYRPQIETLILGCYADLGQRIRLRTLVLTYCTHLINTGFSRQYLLDYTNRRFFTKDISKVERRTLSRFFSGLSEEDRRFRVWASVPANTGSYLRQLGLTKVYSLAELPYDADVAFHTRSNFMQSDRYCYLQVTAKDEFSAAQLLNQRLLYILAMTFLGKTGLELSWSDEMYVKRLKAANGELIKQSGINLQRRTHIVGGRTRRSMRDQTIQILTSFDNQSTERLLSAIRTSALARSTSSPENQLISLWSAVEVLISDPPAGVPRIVHYVDLLAPCICLKYTRRYIIAMYDELLVGYRKPLTLLLSSLSLPKGMDPYSQFTYLMFDPARSAERREILDICAANPLALHRLWKLNHDFGSPREFLATLKGHEERVRWQLHRIYRARNQLVHSGSVPAYLQSLVLNAFEYFRSAVGPVLGRASREEGESDIDQIVRELGFEYTIYKKRLSSLQKENTFSAADVLPMFR